MDNFVRLSGMLARRYDDYFVLDCNGVFVDVLIMTHRSLTLPIVLLLLVTY